MSFLNQLDFREKFNYIIGVLMNLVFRIMKPSRELRNWHHERFKHVFEIREVYNNLSSINGAIVRNRNTNFVTFDYDTNIVGLKVQLRKRSSDFAVFRQIVIHKEYDWAIELLASRDVKKVIDAGGNIGLFSILFAKLFPDSEILTLEPDTSNFNLLKKNVQLNNCHQVKCLNAGIWNKTTHLGIDRNFRDKREWSISLKEYKDPNLNKTAVYCLDDLQKLYNFKKIDFLKIDIEGGEYSLFSDDFIKNKQDQIGVIAVEIHDIVGKDKTLIYSLLDKYSFKVFEECEYTIAINKEF